MGFARHSETSEGAAGMSVREAFRNRRLLAIVAVFFTVSAA